MPVHTVKQGEHLSGIAGQYGFRDYRTIWDDPQNSALQKQRKDPHVLFPGDSVYIPEKRQGTEKRPTGDVHVFKLKGRPLMLRLVLRDFNEDPIANTPCTLTIEKRTYKVTTDAEGRINQPIQRSDHTGKLVFGQTELQLLIGDLDPVAECSGWRERLNNLGYFAGAAADPDDSQVKSAIEQFQTDSGMTVDGDCGPQTQKALLGSHGS